MWPTTASALRVRASGRWGGVSVQSWLYVEQKYPIFVEDPNVSVHSKAMGRGWQIGIALMVALAILLSFIHPATSVLAGWQAKLLGMLQLAALTVFSFVTAVFVSHSPLAKSWLCAPGQSGTARVRFICSFLC